MSEEIPFEHDITIDDLTDTCNIFNTVSIEKLEVDLNRDDIDLSVKIKRFIEAVDKKTESFIVKGEDLGAYDLSKAPSIIVYICKEGDNLWNIAKKYNTTESEIAELNELKVILPYQIENFEENETLLFFDKILLANFNELKSFLANLILDSAAA